MKNIIIIIIFIFILGGCGAEEENSIPVIHLFQANPTSVESGSEVTLTVLATDKDGDSLSYIYQPGTGSINGTGDTVKWIAPETPGKYSIRVNVSDGKDFSYNSVDITVIEKTVPQPPKEGIIVPGEQASGIKIGDTLAKIESLYGKAEIQVSSQIIFYTYLDVGISFTSDSESRVESIFIFEPNLSKTAAGNGIGSTLVGIKKEFGEPEDVEVDDGTRHWYWTKGIEFEYDENSKVVMIFIFPKGTQTPPNKVLLKELTK